jgi:hypothetical protein
MAADSDCGVMARIQVRQGLQAQLVIGVGDDLAAQVDQEGIAVGRGLDGHHIGHHVSSSTSAAATADLAVLGDGLGKGHNSLPVLALV